MEHLRRYCDEYLEQLGQHNKSEKITVDNLQLGDLFSLTPSGYLFKVVYVSRGKGSEPLDIFEVQRVVGNETTFVKSVIEKGWMLELFYVDFDHLILEDEHLIFVNLRKSKQRYIWRATNNLVFAKRKKIPNNNEPLV